MVLVAWSPVALGAGDDGFSPPHKRVAVPEVVGPWPHTIAPRLTRCRLAEVSRLQLVVTSFGASQDDRHKLRRLRPSVLHEPADATTVYPTSKDNLVTWTRSYAGAIADNAIIPHLLHDHLTPSAVGSRNDVVEERGDSRMNMGWRAVVNPLTSCQAPLGFGHGDHTSFLTFVRSGFYLILLYHFL